MPKAESSVTINAPIEKVWEALVDPEKQVQYAPIAGVSNIKGKPGEKGSSADFEYHLLGLKLTEHDTVVEVEKPTKVVSQAEGSIPSTFTWVLRQEGPAVKVDVHVDYSVPGGILGKIANQLLIERMNQRNLESMTHGLKIFTET
jgi:uncharacterized protein YndB with AHSA1/START domain